MCMKRGQVTLFIILGMLIAVFFWLYYYHSVYIESSSEVVLSQEQTVVQHYVETCLDDVSQEWMERTGSPYTYARVPDVWSYAQPVSKYAESVSNVYNRFLGQ